MQIVLAKTVTSRLYQRLSDITIQVLQLVNPVI